MVERRLYMANMGVQFSNEVPVRIIVCQCMKQQLKHRKVTKRKESMQIHRKRLKNFLNNCTVVQEQCRIFRILFQVDYRGVGESSRPRQSHKLEIAGANPASATSFRIGTAIQQSTWIAIDMPQGIL